MTVAQGIAKTVAFKKQVGLGTAASGSGGQLLRRRTGVGARTLASFESDEIVSHQQSTGVGFGLAGTTYKHDGLMSAGTYKEYWAALLRRDFTSISAMVIGTDCTFTPSGTAGAGTVGDASNGFLTAGLKVGLIGRFTGSVAGTGANNDRNFLITALTAGLMTGIFLDGAAMVSESPTPSITFTPVGKVTMAPMTGHTNYYYTVEDWYSTISRSEVFPDLVVGRAAVNLPSSGNSGVVFDLVGCGTRTPSSAQVLTTPTAETTTGVMTAVTGKLLVGGSLVTNLTSLQFTVDGQLTPDGPVIGSQLSPDVSRGRIKVTGTITALFDGVTLQAIFDSMAPTALVAVCTADGTATSDFISFVMGRVKLTGDAPDDGEKQIMRTYPFTAEINSAGGTSLAYDQTIFWMQDSQA